MNEFAIEVNGRSRHSVGIITIMGNSVYSSGYQLVISSSRPHVISQKVLSTFLGIVFQARTKGFIKDVKTGYTYSQYFLRYDMRTK